LKPWNVQSGSFSPGDVNPCGVHGAKGDAAGLLEQAIPKSNGIARRIRSRVMDRLCRKPPAAAEAERSPEAVGTVGPDMASTVPVRPLPVLVLAGALLAGGLGACSGGGGASGIGIAAGFNAVVIPVADRKAAPAFAGPTLRGGVPFSSAELAGKVVVVNFWGSWCGPCRREQGPLEVLSKEYAPRGVRFVGINARRDQKAAALAYLDEFGVTYPSVYNPDSSIAYDFRVRFMPATFVIDRQGRIAVEVIGALRSGPDLRALIDSELT
jgi:thiol-disulfide isomerase/thioredoxin